jgi:tetratricopeptide (TPR) repeat protein
VWCLAFAASGQQSEADKTAARSLVQQGDALMQSQKYEEALEAYRRADDIMGVPTTSIEVGKVALLLGKLVEANAAFQKAAAYPVRKTEPEPFERARKEARELSQQLSERIPTVTINVSGLPQDAQPEVTLDGKPASTNTEIRVDPGTHEVNATAPGHTSVAETITLEERDTRTVELKLDVAPSTIWPVMWSGYAVAAAALVVGTVTGVFSLNDAAEAKQYCNENGECQEPAKEPLDRSRTLAHVSTASFVVAGVAAVIGTVGLAVSLAAEDDSEDPEVSLGPGAVSFKMRF